jgi:protein LSM14
MPFIGSQISLISKSGIRYEGVLHTINMEESSIALQSVRSFGTEGRRANGPQVPPSNETYEFIIFRGEDIQDLTVMSQPPGGQGKSSVPDDPAIISAGASTTTPSGGLYGGPPTYGASPAAAGPPPPVYGGGGLWGPPRCASTTSTGTTAAAASRPVPAVRRPSRRPHGSWCCAHSKPDTCAAARSPTGCT